MKKEDAPFSISWDSSSNGNGFHEIKKCLETSSDKIFSDPITFIVCSTPIDDWRRLHFTTEDLAEASKLPSKAQARHHGRSLFRPSACDEPLRFPIIRRPYLREFEHLIGILRGQPHQDLSTRRRLTLAQGSFADDSDWRIH